MKTILKLSVLLLYVLYVNLAGAVYLIRSDAPQIKVKKKSLFKEDPNRKDFFKFFIKSAPNTLTGETLVVWKEDAFEQRMQVTGRLLGPTGKETTTKIEPIAGDSLQGVGVAHNAVTNEFLVVYTRDGSIAGRRFNSKVKAIGSEFEIIPGTLASINNHPQVIFNPHTNGYVIVWDRTEGVSAALLDRSGKLSGSTVILKKNPANGYYDDWGNGGPGRWPRVLGLAYLPSGDKLLVVFQQRFSASQGDYWLASLDPTLKNISEKNLSKINENTVDFTFVPNYWNVARGGWGASLVALQDGSAVVYFADNKKVNRRKIDVSGKLSGKASPAFSGKLKSMHLYEPQVAFSTTSVGTIGLLIATELQDQKEKIVWAQTLNSKGVATGEPVAIDEARPDTVLLSSELMALPRNPLDQLFRYIYVDCQNLDVSTGPGSADSQNDFLRFDLDVLP